jgi:hypothetical protein
MEAAAAKRRPHASTENDVQAPILGRLGGTAFILHSTRLNSLPAPISSIEAF